MIQPKSKKQLRLFHTNLQDWYDAYGRKDLPWRLTDDSYAIYISEIMLQQTQVKTVLERFYRPFLEEFPTLTSLAHASQDAVLRKWQGLGYYSRAINLHKAAQACHGTLPRTVEALMALPGIGRNTAHAIAALAYHQAVPVMEANVKRVLARIYAIKISAEKDFWQAASDALDHTQPFNYNQAMMDIGALICVPKNPLCSKCPASSICEGKATPHDYPIKPPRKKTPIRHTHIVVQWDGKQHFLATPRISRFLHGLYQFCEQDNAPKHATLVGKITQKYSHFTLEATIWIAKTNRKSNEWYTLETLHELPMSMAEKKILALLDANAAQIETKK